MNSDRWHRLDALYHEALEHPEPERAAFLEHACDDAALRDELAALLSYESVAAGFLQRPVVTQLADALATGRERLAGKTIGGYRVDALIGSGGMGEVYRARDLRLQRDVAIKVVAEGLDGDAAYMRRFEEEARAASGLNHPGIVTIYGVGESDGLAFIAMELLRGTTLRLLLASGPLPLADAWHLMVQLADALAAAHGAGIVHRDLKPDNIMVTPDGLLKVLDFGIARRDVDATLTANGDRRQWQTGLTADGAIVGTAGYMSPEQAEGRPASRASDQFSFASILFEALTGTRAFAGATASDAITAIVKDDPPLERLDAAIPASLRRILSRAFSKDPAARYTDTRELAAELRQARDEWERARQGGFTRRQAIAAVGTVAASIAVAGVTWAVAFRDRGVRSIAVLPFANVSRDPDIDYLCSGLTERLIARLSLPSMRVPGPSTMASLQRRDLDLTVLRRQLRVDAVVRGSVKRVEGRIRIEAALLDLSSNAMLWNRSYDRAAGEALVVEEEILRGVLDEGIRFHPTDADRAVLARQATADPAAYDLYLRGLGLFRRGTEAGYLNAQDLFRQATLKDGRFAEAYAALAATFSVQAIDGYIRPTEAWVRSFSNADQAIALDPDNATAHAELGSCLFFFGWDVAAAERHFETARRARGGRYEPDLLIAFALERWATGRPQSALELAQQAHQLDPMAVAWRLRVADYTLATGNLEEAVRLYEELTRDLPDDPRAFFGFAEARRRQRRFDEAITLLAAAHATSGNPGLQAVLATAKGEEGLRRVERVTAQIQLEELRRRDESGLYVSPLDFARTYAQLGDVARTFAQLPAAFTEHSSGLVFLEVDRAWDAVRDHPEFRAAVRRVGLAV